MASLGSRGPGSRPSRAFRAVLLLLPGHLRAEHERELDQFLRLEAPQAGVDRLRYWFALLLDVMHAAPRAHLDVLRQDLSLAVRQLRRAPAFAVMAVVTLTIGIGGNAALFSLVDGVLFRPLPFAGADRIATLDESNPTLGLDRFGVSPANFRDLTTDFAGLVHSAAAYQPLSGTVTVDELPDRVVFATVSGGFFSVFQERPVLGRVLVPEDDVPGARDVVVSHSFWESHLGGDPSALDRVIQLDGVSHRVVGVMPAGFAFPSREVSLWKPLGLTGEEWERRGARYLGVVLRLAPDADVALVSELVGARARGLSNQFPDSNEGWVAGVQGLQDAAVGELRTPLFLVWSAAGLILLIAVANVANLLLGRGIVRDREMALRSALGARSGRLVRQLLTEGGVLAAAGTVFGLGLAALLLSQLRVLGQGALPRLDTVGLDARSVGFTVALAALSTLLFSAVPVVAGVLRPPASRLRGGTADPKSLRWQSILVVGEVALAVMVLIGTGLLARSMAAVLEQPLGYQPQDVTIFRVEPPFHVDSNGPMDTVLARLAADRARVSSEYAGLEDRLSKQPGVSAVGAVSRLPLTGQWWITGYALASDPESGNDDLAAYIRVVTPGYLGAMGTRVLRGRGFHANDDETAERVVVIDETFAARHFSGRDALGEILLLDGPPGRTAPRARIIGVVESIRQNGLDADPRPTFYLTLAQATEGHGSNWGMDVVMRSAGAGVDIEAVRGVVREFLPEAAVFRVETMESRLSASIADRRFQMVALAGFAVLALVLTLVGVYGVLALAVRQRTREYGVRLSLGATPWQVRWLVQAHGLRRVLLGVALGLAGALAAARLYATLVYGISVFDPAAFAVGPLALLLVGLVGAAVPAIRATRVDPAAILREE